ncbi:hypothetical protein PWP93_26590 [Paraburkholderia sp. A1RI-2L]|uniref:hypothetical protein n=1 Tax=Paraburkholderia sp. A1RI-2L TaxID=3028367 RepID=UPI003B81D873
MDGFGLTSEISDFLVLDVALRNMAVGTGSIDRKGLLAEITRFIDLLERAISDKPACRNRTYEARILLAQDLPLSALDQIDALLVSCGAQLTLRALFAGPACACQYSQCH